MCKKLLIGTNVIVPGTKIKLKNKILRWGVDLGYGPIANARIESIKDGVWKKRGFTHIENLIITGFYEESPLKKTKFLFPKNQTIGILHNENEFLVITEPSTGNVKLNYNRQPCFINLKTLL